MKKFLYKIFLFGLAVFLLLNIVSYLSLYFLGKSNYYKQQFVVNGVKETTFDYVVLGSSTGLTTLDTKLIDSLSNKKGLNISMDDSGLSSHYLMLKFFYDSGKQTDKLVLAVTSHDIGNKLPSISDNDYRFLPHIYNSEVYDYFQELDKTYFNVFTLSKYCPLIGVSYFNAEVFYPSLIAAMKPLHRNRFDNRGNYSYPNNSKTLKKTEKNIKEQNIQINNPYYHKIKEFCNQKDIELIVYLSPVYKVKASFTDNVKIINHSNFLESAECFYDNIHVNGYGRKECSTEFAKVIFK